MSARGSCGLRPIFIWVVAGEPDRSRAKLPKSGMLGRSRRIRRGITGETHVATGSKVAIYAGAGQGSRFLYFPVGTAVQKAPRTDDWPGVKVDPAVSEAVGSSSTLR